MALPSAMPSELPGSPGGRIGVAPAARRVERKRAGPTRSSASTAGHVERLLQRAPHRDGALVVAVEVARQPVLEAHRHVLDQRFGMKRAVVEGQGVDHRLQRRAGRAMGAHEIDLAGAAEEVAAAQPGHDAAGAVVHHHHRDLRLVGHLAALVGDELGKARLELQADRGRHDRAGRLRRRARSRDAARSSASPGAASAPAGSSPCRTAAGRSRRPRARAPARGRGRPCAATGERSGRRRVGDCGMATSRAASAALSCLGSLPK